MIVGAMKEQVSAWQGLEDRPFSSPSIAAPTSLSVQHFSQLHIAKWNICVMYSNMSLQVIRSWVFVFTAGAVWTYIARRLMNKLMTDHFVFALEALAHFGALAAFDRAIVRTDGGVNGGV